MNTKNKLYLCGALFIAALLFTLFAVPSLHVFASMGTVIGGGLMCANAPLVLPKDFTEKLDSTLKGISDEHGTLKKDVAEASKLIKSLSESNEKLLKDFEESKKQLDQTRKQLLQRGTYGTGKRLPGFVSDEAAKHLAANFILHVERSGKLDAFAPAAVQRDAWIGQVKSVLGIEAKTGLGTAEVPLPTAYYGEMRELIAEFGVIRKSMFPFPLTGGVSRPARMGTRPAFGSIAMAGAFAEKKPTFGFASLESHKLGGFCAMPRELEEQSIVALGQFLARYGAVEFARAEDTWGFLADGSNDYETVVGLCKTAADNGKLVTLDNGKTAPSDAVLENFRAMRGNNVASPVLARGKYYLNPTWEARLRAFNTKDDMNVYVHNGPNGPTLDGYQVVWTEVLQPYQKTAAAGTNLAVFGDLSFWWFGERGNPRIDMSEHVYFLNDMTATRFIEEIDFDYMAVDAASVLKTAAA